MAELMCFLVGALLGMILAFESAYLGWKKPLERERNEYKKQRDEWRKIACDFKKINDGLTDACTDALNLASAQGRHIEALMTANGIRQAQGEKESWRWN